MLRRVCGSGLAAFALVGIAATLAAQQGASRTIRVDGSSTVAPIMFAAEELYRAKNAGVSITVGVSGTGGGFKRFLESQPDLRTDISNASRPIKSSELTMAKERGIEFIELPIALDGIAIVVNPANKFCEQLTLEELKRIWSANSPVTNWKDIRAGFPDLPLKLYGPGTDSGTYDFFVETVLVKERCRADYTANESDNILVQGIAGDRGALGYFGYSYYEANKAKIKLLAVDNGDGKPIAPSLETIRSGAYHPLSRPLFLYVSTPAAQRAEVRGFLEFLFANAPKIVEHKRVNYVSLSPALYEESLRRLREGVAGTVFPDGHAAGKSLEQWYLGAAAPEHP